MGLDLSKFISILKFIFKAAGAIGWTILFRLFNGARRPKWSFKLEVAMGMLQSFRNDNPVLEKARIGMEKSASWPVKKPVSFAPKTLQRKDGSEMPIEWLYPQGVPTIEESKTKKVILYLHGGAYCLGSINTHRKLSSFFAILGDCRMLLIDYRLAPEFPFPAALEDAHLAYDFLTQTCGIGEKQIIVMGDSAGGGLSLSLSLSMLAQPNKKGPGAIICLSPWVNLDFSCETSKQLQIADEQKDVLEELSIETTLTKNCPTDYLPEDVDTFSFYAKAYGGTNLRNALVSPVFAQEKHLSLLPPTLFIVGGGEQLCGQIQVLAKRLTKCNPNFECETYQDMPHVFQFIGFLDQTKEATDRVIKFMKKYTYEATSPKSSL